VDVLTALSNTSDYSKTQLQLIVGAWVMGGLVEAKQKIDLTTGDVSEDDYDKGSLYSLLYALYRSMGTVKAGNGESYEFTFNTWGYTWPKSWGTCPNPASDPQLMGKNAYAGLYHFEQVKEYIKARDGKVHIVEMGCGTGAGAHHIASKILPNCTYEAVDMQQAGINSCKRKFVPELNGRLVATCGDATKLTIADNSADFVAINETHVTEMPGKTTEEDVRFFTKAYRMIKPGGFLVWGNAIPESTWKPCFELIESLGMKILEVCDVTKEAVQARDEDKARIDAYVDQIISTFHGFKIPVLGGKRSALASVALKNFSRNPGTNLYTNMVDGTDTYKVILIQKPLTAQA
jgi:ubiquinone/menaquinone biosynthesis C-methylase UbiE